MKFFWNIAPYFISYDQIKEKLSVRMELPMIRARLRVKINGPPLTFEILSSFQIEMRQRLMKKVYEI